MPGRWWSWLPLLPDTPDCLMGLLPDLDPEPGGSRAAPCPAVQRQVKYSEDAVRLRMTAWGKIEAAIKSQYVRL